MTFKLTFTSKVILESSKISLKKVPTANPFRNYKSCIFELSSCVQSELPELKFALLIKLQKKTEKFRKRENTL